MKPSTCLRGLLLSLLLVCGRAYAQTPEEIFERANQAYERGAFADAAEGYRSLLKYRVQDPRLEYNLANAHLIKIAVDCVRRARAVGKHAGILGPPGPLLDAVIEAGSDLYFCGGDIADLSRTWLGLLARTPGDEKEA